MRPVLALIVASLFLAPAPAAAEVWTRSFPAGRHPTVRVTSEDAKVNVHARPGGTVDVRVESFGGVTGLHLGRIEPRVRIEQRDGAIEVEVETYGVSAGITVSTLRFEVDVAVPPACDLDVRTSDGPVRIAGIHGSVVLNSSDGRVTLNDLQGTVRLRTSDGTVLAQRLDGRLDAATRDGSVRVSGRFDHLALEAHDGGMEVEVAPRSKVAEGWSLTSTDGGILLRLPDELRATLDARVRDGNLDVELASSGQIEASDLRAVRIDLNGGGPVLRVRSSDGSVRIRGGS